LVSRDEINVEGKGLFPVHLLVGPRVAA